MLKTLVRAAGAATALFCLAAPAAAQTPSRLGWLPELSGSCWQGQGANGAIVDRQCFQTQFGRVVRATITRGEYRGETVLGFSDDRGRLELYSWGTQGGTAILTPALVGGEYLFAGADPGVRAVWRRSGEGFQVAEQRRNGAEWADTQVITYSRHGAAQAAVSASGVRAPSAGFGWLDRIAGSCYTQVEPSRNVHSRGCFEYKYQSVLQQTWYANGQASGEAILFRDGDNLGFFYWDANGGFGVGESMWMRRSLVSVTDAETNVRRALRLRGNGFEITTERRTSDAREPWEFARRYRFAR